MSKTLDEIVVFVAVIVAGCVIEDYGGDSPLVPLATVGAAACNLAVCHALGLI